ncbi:hypothetical protein K491DRAFT_774639 [Lophiostoma macrostomum CBS 122681]|uniref:BTB domain-containing protein n=1 Tax=Lophiostoma macrostomum CBS 122681 TaxID=1314788 RepID=A0A6A6TL27_9PLEO|nr:hypothetical protein K491DRAFT_774639 [Lophiostoma macrostomum CBS 122681]
MYGRIRTAQAGRSVWDLSLPTTPHPMSATVSRSNEYPASLSSLFRDAASIEGSDDLEDLYPESSRNHHRNQAPQPQPPLEFQDARIAAQAPGVASFDPTGFLIDITVGLATNQTYDSRNLFHVHVGVICPRSGFFKGLMNNDWREKADGAVSLPDDDPVAFRQYIRILYGQPIQLPGGNQEAGANRDRKYAEQSTILAQIFVLADKLLDPVTKNLIVDTILAHALSDISLSTSGTGHVRAPSTAAINHIYENTPGACPVRRMMVDLFLGALAPGAILTTGFEFAEELMEDFKYDVENEVVRRKGEEKIGKGQNYSNHGYFDPRRYRD